jgi:hypothetical protein
VNRGDCESCDNTTTNLAKSGEMLMRSQGYSSEGGTCTIVPPFEERSEPPVTSRDGVKCLVVQHAVFGGGGGVIPYKLVRVGLNLTENNWRCKAQSALKLYFAWQKQRSARLIKLDPNPLSPIYTVDWFCSERLPAVWA